jgi:hypothetical protein
MREHVVYNEETGLWYKHDASPLTVRIVGKGEKLVPFVSAKASTYPEAFEIIYGHALVIPPPVRAPRREPILP